MSEFRPKRTYRDSIFRKYIGERNALAHVHTATTGETIRPEELQITTLRSVLFHRLKNDLSYRANNRSHIIMEQQSTWNPNMPLRMLFYISLLYRRDIPKGSLLYSGQRIPLLTPRFNVFYNGSDPAPEIGEMRLSEAFLIPSKELELVVKIYNIRYDVKPKILEKCRELHDYSFFSYEVERLQKHGTSLEQAIYQTMDYCIAHDIMKEFLEAHSEEVFDMVSLRWNEKDAREAYLQEGREEGLREGLREGLESTVLKMLRRKFDLSEIVECTGVPLDRVRELAQTL